MTKPTLSPLNSSMITGHHYDPASSKLTLSFKNGDTYEYSDVPMERATAFVGAASPGTFFANRIRGQYPHRKL